MRKNIFYRKLLLIIPVVIILKSGSLSFGNSLEDDINLYCLRHSYPQIVNMEKDSNNVIWLILKNGNRVAYSQNSDKHEKISGDMKESLEQIYPLEPLRPETPAGFAPGRKRPYKFFENIYGETPAKVKDNLARMPFFNKNIQLANNASLSLKKVIPKLEQLAAKNKNFKEFLLPEGGYYWRNIAGENYRSPHSYGIALDIGVKKSPYWRWSKIQPHPLQKSYPGELAGLFENQGFIWGGKWHEYDIMHFEYRPELICKAHLMKFLQNSFSLPYRH